jgi:hypothetical protein
LIEKFLQKTSFDGRIYFNGFWKTLLPVWKQLQNGEKAPENSKK